MLRCLLLLLVLGVVPGEYYAPPTELAEIADDRLDEISGIVASRTHADRFYVHNDSGDQPRVFVLDRAGRTVCTIRLAGARHVDWEDIALAPAADTEDADADEAAAWDIVVADIGDNRSQRKLVTLYRFREPTAAELARDQVTVRPTRHQLRYAGGPCDAEALIVAPATGDAYILTKRRDDAPVDVYHLPAPWPTDRPTTLARVGQFRLPGATPLARQVTAADVRPDGERVAVRTYFGGFEWRRPANDPPVAFHRLFELRPRTLDLAAEPQGEALCYSADGAALLTVSELRPTYLFEARLVSPAAR